MGVCAPSTRWGEQFGLYAASPYVHLVSPSRDLNLCCEPPEFLTEGERETFEPVMFFGSLPSEPRPDDRAAGESLFPGGVGRRIYVSFGEYAWQRYPAEAIAVVTAIATAADDPGTDVLVSLGGAPLHPTAVAQIERPKRPRQVVRRPDAGAGRGRCLRHPPRPQLHA